ncbi:hypothetical protein C1701_04495 [Actinoalloteichus sp. AHMU CJ021]|nr:hypothetical protein C1701_04495 [Actinoalloteichus sp. AHMU CJ021]
MQQAQCTGHFGGCAVPMRGKFLPEGHCASCGRNRLVDVGYEADCGNALLLCPTGDLDFLRCCAELSWSSHADHDTVGQAEDRVFSETNGLGSVRIESYASAGFGHRRSRVARGRHVEAGRISVVMRCRSPVTSGTVGCRAA